MLSSWLWLSQVALLCVICTGKLQLVDQKVNAKDAMNVYYENAQRILTEHGRGLALVAPNTSLPTKTGLSDTCSNKLCEMFEKALSCKAIGLDFDKICARYTLGAILQCPKFPGPNDIYNAPSICGNQIASRCRYQWYLVF